MTIAEIVTDLENGWNSGKGAAWAARFAPDTEFVDAVGRVQRGREEIAREHQKLFDTIYAGSRVAMEVLRDKEISPDVRLAHIRSTLRVPAGPRAGEVSAVITLIIIDDQIVAFHNTMETSLAELASHDAELAARRPLDWRPTD